MVKVVKGVLHFEGCNFFRQRVVLAQLSGKAMVIENIRPTDLNPGIRPFENSFLRLMNQLTNGTRIELNESGSRVYYQPGLLRGGKIEHECNIERSIGYYLEAIIYLAPFCKFPIKAILKGVTNDNIDISVDSIKHGTLPVLKKFLGVDEGLEMKVIRRGLLPNGGGEVHFSCPVRKQLKTVQVTDPGKIKRIRGVAFATKMSPVAANRIIESAKGVLLKYLPDIYIYTDNCRGAQSGKSPGFGISLVAESTTGCFITADVTSNPAGSDAGPSVPEDLGVKAAYSLMEEIYRGGCADSNNQSLACLFMALGQQNVSKFLIGPLSPYTIQFLRHINDFFQVMFKLDVQTQSQDQTLKTGTEKILLTCAGVNYTNLSKPTI
ncbi:rRNA-processing endoribonuclease [Chamberlinius hualienensis]